MLLEICLEITYSAIAKNPEVFFDVLKTGENEKSYIFQVWCHAFTKNFEWLANETVLGQSSPNRSGGKICKTCKTHSINHISCKEYLDIICVISCILHKNYKN